MNYVEVGKIIKPHGLNGSMKILSFSDFEAMRFEQGNTIYIEQDNEMIPLVVKKFSASPKATYLQVEEFNHIDDVAPLRQQLLYIKKDDQHELTNNRYYRSDLFDMNVVLNEKIIGSVIDILDVPQGEMLRIQDSLNNTKLIPFRKEFIDKIDIHNKEIHLIEWEGLL